MSQPLWSDEKMRRIVAGYAQRGWTAAAIILQEMHEDAMARITELESIIAYIDGHAPRADGTCDEPGITLSEAARRAMRDGPREG